MTFIICTNLEYFVKYFSRWVFFERCSWQVRQVTASWWKLCFSKTTQNTILELQLWNNTQNKIHPPSIVLDVGGGVHSKACWLTTCSKVLRDSQSISMITCMYYQQYNSVTVLPLLDNMLFAAWQVLVLVELL